MKHSENKSFMDIQHQTKDDLYTSIEYDLIRGRNNLPKGWEIKSLKDVCEKILDGTHISPKTSSGSYKYITSKNIRNDGIDESSISYISEEEHKAIYKRCPVKEGDILLTKDGANENTVEVGPGGPLKMGHLWISG